MTPLSPNICIAHDHESLTWDDTHFDFGYIDGHFWRVKADFPFHYLFDSRHVDGCVPANFLTNFHSVPRILWPLIHPFEFGQAAAIHDWLYATHHVSRAVADEIYLAALTKCGAGELRRKAMYRAVRLFGWNAYRKGGKK